MAVKEGVAADRMERGGQRDLGERGASTKRRLAHGEEGGGENASREGGAVAEGLVALVEHEANTGSAIRYSVR